MDVLTRGSVTSRMGGMRIEQSENTNAIPAKSQMQTRSSRVALGYIENQVGQDKAVPVKRDPVKKDAEPLRPRTAVAATKKDPKKLETKPKGFLKPRPVSAAVSKSSLASNATIVSDIVKNEVHPALLETRSTIASTRSYGDLSAMDISADRTDVLTNKCRVEDIDANDSDNPQLVSEYVNDIYDYMMYLERVYSVKQNFLGKEGQGITPKMRAILVDWLCQVHHRFHLLQETLYLTLSIIDRYLQIVNVTKNRLQLVGVTSMLIASKYEEMYATEVADFVYITDNAYTKADIRQMEIHILSTLEFNLGKPMCLHFLRRNSKAGQVDATKHTLAKYLMELTITEYDFAHVHPSLIAAAALALSMRVLDDAAWTDTLAHYSHYSQDDLLPTMKRLAALVIKSEKSKLVAIKSKYQSSKFMKISTIQELKGDCIRHLATATTAESTSSSPQAHRHGRCGGVLSVF